MTAEEIDLTTPPADVHPACADGLELTERLRATYTSKRAMAACLDCLRQNPQATGTDLYTALAATDGVSEGTLRKLWWLLATGEPPPLPASHDPLDEIRRLRGEEPRNPVPLHAETIAANARADALARRIAELESELTGLDDATAPFRSPGV